MKLGLFVAVAIVVGAVFLPRLLKLYVPAATRQERARVQQHYQHFFSLVQPLEKQLFFLKLNKNNTAPDLKVALGYNSNVDLVIHGTKIAQILLETYKQNTGENVKLDVRDHENVDSEQAFFESFLHSFSKGGAIERFIHQESLFNNIIREGLKQIEDPKFKRRYPNYGLHIGGNAALMSLKFANDQWKVLLSGAIAPKLKSLLQLEISKLNQQYKSPLASISFISYVTKLLSGDASNKVINEKEMQSRRTDFTFSKEYDEDEYHVIMEFEKGSRFMNHTAPRSNRFIATRDFVNAEFLTVDSFHDNIKSFEPDLIVLAGFGLLDAFDSKEKRLQKLNHIQQKLQTDTSKAIKHLELQSIGKKELYMEISETVFPYIDSIGLNEQELEALYKVLTNEQESLGVAQTIPDLKNVTKALTFVMNRFPAISRIHFHSLAYHLLVVRNAEVNNIWGTKERKSAATAAVASSSLTATSNACGLLRHQAIQNDFSKYEVIFDVSSQAKALGGTEELKEINLQASSKKSMNWQSDKWGLEFYLAPVLVCKQVVRTVGLGDSISAAGLSTQMRWLRVNELK